jgi:hypothetical protein
MNRRSRREALKFAKKQGFDPTKPDLGVVTAHYTTDHIQVITEASSYVINLKDKVALRIEGDDASHLHHDSEWYPYDEIYSCSVGFPLRMTWYDGERLLLRETTLITQVNEITKEEADQICTSTR